MCLRVVVRLHQKQKSMFFEKKSSLSRPLCSSDALFEKMLKNPLISAFEANGTTAFLILEI